MGAPVEFLAAARLLAAREEWSAWRGVARREQVPPEGSWFLWLILAGRGWGKTWTGARWLAERARQERGDWAVIGRTDQDTREVCVEGGSGLLAALGLDRGSREYSRTSGQIRLSNGSTIYSYSAESPERGRGPNLSGVWADELAAWRFATQTWQEVLLPAVRIGKPQIVVTTTPHKNALLKEFLSRDDGSVVVTRGTTFENRALSPEALAEFRRFEGTRIGRQELLGELLDDVEGALWSREVIDAERVGRLDRSRLLRVMVAVDPAMSSGPKSNETGIVVCGVDREGHGYVLDDRSCRLPPDGWARVVCGAYEDWAADRVVAEQNQGGQLVESVLRTVKQNLPLKLVQARFGKVTRAEPIAALYEQGKVSHVGVFAELEDQLCTWEPRSRESPDRLDALVWALTALNPGVLEVAAPLGLSGRSRWAPVRQGTLGTW